VGLYRHEVLSSHHLPLIQQNQRENNAVLKPCLIHLGATYAVTVDHGVASLLCQLATVCGS